MDSLAEALQDPSAYPFPIDQVEFHQTHISWVFLAGDFAYKVKKPVDFGFLDYSTLENRRFYCDEEVRLNRRLAPTLYLGVAPITLENGRPRFEGSGEPIDYAVKMRRLESERMLDHLVQENAVGPPDIERLAALVERFHLSAEGGNEVARWGRLEVLQENWEENFTQVEPFVGRTISVRQLERCRAFVDEQLSRRGALFEGRLRDGRIRDCHGDLRAESVWMSGDGHFEIYDCIEFSARYRCSDVASEVAFLATDLEARGRPDLSWSWTDRYVSLSGDTGLREVLPFYKCYRAFVRGKVEGLALDQEGFRLRELEKHQASARRRFELAALYATPLRPALVLICGQVGTGKTTLARSLGSLLNIEVVSSDVVRKRLAGLAPEEHRPDELGAGLYASEMTSATYGALLQAAQGALGQKRSVILDATFNRAEDRARAIEAAARAGAEYLVLEATVPLEVARERVLRRAKEAHNPSDAGIAIMEQTRRSFQEPVEIPAERLRRVDMSQPLRQAAAEAISAILAVSEAAPH